MNFSRKIKNKKKNNLLSKFRNKFSNLILIIFELIKFLNKERIFLITFEVNY